MAASRPAKKAARASRRASGPARRSKSAAKRPAAGRHSGADANPEARHAPARASRQRPALRRALSNVGGAVELQGDPELGALLSRAFEAAEREPADRLTHGFHSYPARLHPALAARLILELTRPGEIVLDPFAGSGTVVVEAMAGGRAAFGADLNPLAVRVMEARTLLTDRSFRRQFDARLQDVAARSEEHVRERAAIRAPLSRTEAAWYQGHTLRELGGLWHEIEAVEDALERRMLQMVFSAIVVKFSRQRADTAEERVDKRLRKGLPTEFFVRKGEELIARWTALSESVPRRTPAAELRLADAREPAFGARLRARLVLSSPPYGGTYDYRAHHARRYPWLGIDSRAFDVGELGARRRYAGGDARAALASWDRELGAALGAAGAQCARGGWVAWLLGDAELAGRRVDAREQLARLAEGARLEPVAAASQLRADPRGGPPRREHLLLLRRAD